MVPGVLGGPESEEWGRIGERLMAVRQRIAEATSRAGRPADTIRLVAVSKGKPADAIRAVHAAGHRTFGENYAQEFAAKARELSDLEIDWHFIGHLQQNKARVVVPHASMLQSVDRESLALELDRRAHAASKRLDVLIEVNLAGERTKGGCAPNDVPRLLDAIEETKNLDARGLMAIPPAEPDPRPYFAALRGLFDRDRRHMTELSMGMSADFEIAIEEGATIVRVGTAIFGERSR